MLPTIVKRALIRWISDPFSLSESLSLECLDGDDGDGPWRAATKARAGGGSGPLLAFSEDILTSGLW
jgi:hypothetical protein